MLMLLASIALPRDVKLVVSDDDAAALGTVSTNAVHKHHEQ